MLERCHAKRVRNETRPYAFTLMFEGDISRTYFLSAFSQGEMDAWIKAISVARCVCVCVCVCVCLYLNTCTLCICVHVNCERFLNMCTQKQFFIFHPTSQLRRSKIVTL